MQKKIPSSQKLFFSKLRASFSNVNSNNLNNNNNNNQGKCSENVTGRYIGNQFGEKKFM